MMAGTEVYIAFAGGVDGQKAHREICGMTLFARAVHAAVDGGAARIFVASAKSAMPAEPPVSVPITYDAVLPAEPNTATPIIMADLIAGVAIIDDASAKRARKALLNTCRRDYDGVGDRFVIRYVSLVLTSLLCRLPITPNQVTIANSLVGLAACAAASHGSPAAIALAGALMFLQVVLDSCDGELARLTYQRSRIGMIIDNVGDDVIDTLFIASLGVGLGGSWLPIGLGVSAARAVSVIIVYVSLWRAGLGGDVMAFRWWFDTSDSLAARFNHAVTPMTVVRGLGRRDLYCLVWAVTCVLGLPQIAMGLGSAVSVALFALGVLHLCFQR